MIPPDPDDVDQFRADETGETVDAFSLHHHLAVGYWTVPDEGDADTGGASAPTKWVVLNDAGEKRTFRRIEDEGG